MNNDLRLTARGTATRHRATRLHAIHHNAPRLDTALRFAAHRLALLWNVVMSRMSDLDLELNGTRPHSFFHSDDLREPSSDKQVIVEMAARSMMTGLDDLVSLAHDGHGAELVHQNIDDLELTYSRLGTLLRTLRQPVKEAAE